MAATTEMDKLKTTGTAQDFATALGRAQQSYQSYKGRSDLQQGASQYGDQIRQLAQARGINLAPYGTTNANGMDYTKNYTGAQPNAYDPSQAGQQLTKSVNTTGDAPVTPPPSGNSNTTGGQSSGNASLINQQYDANYASQLQKLRDIRDQQLAGLSNQENVIGQNRISQLNNNDAVGAQQLKQLQEIQANNGVRGGDSITATIGQNTAQGQNANMIEQNSGNQLKDLTAQRNQINNAANSNDLALMQQLQAARSGQLIDNNNTQDQRALQLAMLMGKDANGNNTLGGNQFDLQKQNQGFNQNLQTNQFDLQKQGQRFTQGLQTQQMEQAAKQFAQTMGLNYAQLSVQQQNILGQLAIGQQNANTNATQASNSFTLGNRNADIAQQNADSEGKLRDAQGVYYGDRGNSLTPGSDKAYKDAVAAAQKDVVGWANADTPEKQAALIDRYYQKLKSGGSTPNGVSDADISAYLNKP